MKLLADILLLLALPPYLIWLVLYLTRSPWRRRPTGKFLVLVFGAILALLTQNSASVWLVDYTGRQPIRVALYAMVAVDGYAWLWNYLRVRRSGDDPHHEAERLIQPGPPRTKG